jgi:4-amino-4-deoxy-L-arabinose transferase-like glycosyltransferase
MSVDLSGAPRRSSPWPWLSVALALVAMRLPYMRGPLTDPHAWRQCDTVHTALDFYRRGFDLMHPAVGWLGGHRTLLLNFPLSEAMSALLYRAFGPDPMWDRVVSLFFCLVATAYLGATARYLAGRRAGRLATLAYLAIPLSQYFSRVPHIEFGVIAFVNGTLYHTLRAYEEKSTRQAIFGALCGIAAGLIKGPYLATIGMPVLAMLLHAPTRGRVLRGVVPLACAVVAFELWRRHVDIVNATVPNWTFLPDFYKEVNPIWRYVGTLEERLVPMNWIRIARRLVYELATPIGVFIAAATLWRRPGPGIAPGRTSLGARTVALLWYANCLVHVVVFFRLNSWHNYYQMPFIAPTALLIGLGADWLWARLPRPGGLPLGGVVFAGFLLMTLWVPYRVHYGEVDWLRTEAGPVIAARIPAGDLVVASDFSTLPPTDPRLLFRADREGWPMRSFEITPDRLNRLRAWDAKWVVVLTDPGHPGTQPPAFLEPARVATLPVRHEGRQLGTVHVFDLSLPYGGRQEVGR